jgi:hypothetical protein
VAAELIVLDIQIPNPRREPSDYGFFLRKLSTKSLSDTARLRVQAEVSSIKTGLDFAGTDAVFEFLDSGFPELYSPGSNRYPIQGSVTM